MAKASRISSNFGSDAEKQSLYIPAKEEKIHSQSSTFCRYYPAGSCRRGSACRFGHLQPPSVPQEYARPNEHVVHTRTCRYNAAGYCQRGSACHFVPQEYVYPNAHEVYTRTPHKGWDQNVGHSHGYTSYARYTVDPHIAPYGFGARYAFDNSSDVSSSDSTSSDQGSSAAFRSMTIEEPVYSACFPSAFSPSSSSLQYPNNTVTRYSDVSYPAYYRGCTPTGFKSRTATHRNAEQVKEKRSLFRTKPCKFFSTRKTCSEGNKCRFIHDVEKSKRARKADSPSQAHRTTPSELPSTPCSLQEELKARNYYPITWRVIGGGVMMGLPCKAFAAGYCPDGNDCRLAHETEVWTSENGVVQLKTQTSATSVAASSSPKPSLDSGTESQCSIFSTDCAGSSHHTDESTFSSINDAETSTSAVNSDKVVPSQRRRTRSMSMPTSPTVLRAPHIFAEL